MQRGAIAPRCCKSGGCPALHSYSNLELREPRTPPHECVIFMENVSFIGLNQPHCMSSSDNAVGIGALYCSQGPESLNPTMRTFRQLKVLFLQKLQSDISLQHSVKNVPIVIWCSHYWEGCHCCCGVLGSATPDYPVARHFQQHDNNNDSLLSAEDI